MFDLRKQRGDNSKHTPFANSLENTNEQANLTTPPPFQLQSKESIVEGMGKSFGSDFSGVKIHENSSEAKNVNARAFTQANNIHFAPGEYSPGTKDGQHLIAHELSHVIQQKKGQVSPDSTVNGREVNSSAKLENEADRNADKIISGQKLNLGSAGGQQSQWMQHNSKAIQRKTAHYGDFDDEKYDKSADGKKLHAAIKFKPNEKVNAKKIGFTQAIRKNVGGSNIAIDPAAKERMVDSGSAEGWRIDRISSKTNPIYGASDLSGTDGLDQTNQTNNSTANPTELNPDLGRNATYDLGHRYDDAGTEKKKDAGLYDGPTILSASSSSVEFESTALALEGDQKGMYYGSVKWGYEIDSTGAFKKIPFELVSQGMPSNNFLAAAEKWNSAKSRGTYKAVKDNVVVKKIGNSAEEVGKLAKDDEATQISPVKIGGVSYIKVDITTGSLSGKQGYVLPNDLIDKGDGKDTTDLPVGKVLKISSAAGVNLNEGLSLNGPLRNDLLPQNTRVRIVKPYSAGPKFLGLPLYYDVEVVDGSLIGARGYLPFNVFGADG